MRACVRTALRPLLLADTPTADLGLAPVYGVPRLDRGCTDSLHASVAALLAWHRRKIDPQRLLGYSGAAFRIAWRRDLLWCPSGLQVHLSDPFAALGATLGLRWRKRAGQPFTKALEFIRRQLALDRPVLTSGLRGQAEWGIIVQVAELAYVPSPRHDQPPTPVVKLAARTPDDPGDEYSRLDASPWHGYLPGEPTQRLWSATPLAWVDGFTPPQPLEVALQSTLERAVAWSRGSTHGTYALGPEAYDAWQAALLDEDENSTAPAIEVTRRAWANAYLASRLRDARQAAAWFCNTVAEEVEPTVGRLLALAAREYDGVGTALEGLLEPFEPVGDKVPWERFTAPEVRAELAARLSEAQRHDRTAAAYVLRALKRLG